MDNLREILKLAETCVENGEKFYEKGIKKYATETRKTLQQIVSMCRESRKEILTKVKEMPKKKPAEKKKKADDKHISSSEEESSDEESSESEEKTVQKKASKKEAKKATQKKKIVRKGKANNKKR